MKYNIKVYSLSYDGKRRDLILESRGVDRHICTSVINRYAKPCYSIVISGFGNIIECPIGKSNCETCEHWNGEISECMYGEVPGGKS